MSQKPSWLSLFYFSLLLSLRVETPQLLSVHVLIYFILLFLSVNEYIPFSKFKVLVFKLDKLFVAYFSTILGFSFLYMGIFLSILSFIELSNNNSDS